MHKGAWPSLEIQNDEKSLVALRKLVDEKARSEDDDVVRELARFLVVRSCAFLERVSEECCRSYLRSKSNPRSAAFGESWLGRSRSPSPENLVQLVQRFDHDWAKEFRQFLAEDDERLGREVSFLVDRRNKIAHGLSERVTTQKAIALSYISQDITDWFVKRLDPRG